MRQVRFIRWDLALFLLVFLLKNILIVSAQNVYFVATNGNDNNPGTIDMPFATWQKGFNAVNAGDTLFIRGGVYYPVGTDNGGGTYYGAIASHNNGTSDNMINVWAYPGETPIFDCSKITQPTATFIAGIGLWDCDYWHLKGLQVRNTFQQPGCLYAQGFNFSDVQHCKFELLVAHDIQSAGIVIINGGYGTTTDNLLLNCDVNNCYDPLTIPAGGNADGYNIGHSKASDSTKVIGCRSWNNSDDGFDLWNGEGVTKFDSCWSFNNGNHSGDGNGFKFGITSDETDAIVGRHISNCIAAGNHSLSGGNGFDQNGGKVLMNLYNNFSYKNGFYGFSFSSPNLAHILKNNVSYLNLEGNYWGASNVVTEYNSWDTATGVTVKSDDFFSLDTMQLYRERKTDGSLPDIDFGKIKSSSDLVIAGVSVFNYVTHITVTGAGGETSIRSNNGTLQLSASLLPTDATNKTITWSLQNGTGKASISSSGLVTAIADGFVTAKVIANDGSGVSETLDITISGQIISVTGINITGAGSVNTITSNKGTLRLSATILPADASYKTVTWAIESVTGQATINSAGLVTAIDNGIVIARATANDGSDVSDTLTLTISNQIIPVTGITVTKESNANTITAVGETLQLNALIFPVNATNKTVTWSISNGTGQATVSSTGLVTAVAEGIVTATASANDGAGHTGSLEILLSKQTVLIESIQVAPLDVNLPVIIKQNESLQMVADFIPTDASYCAVEWSVENHSGTATINDSGLVTGVSNGLIKVIAKAKDGSDKTGYCMVAIANQSIVIKHDDDRDQEFYAVLLSDRLIINPVSKSIKGDFCSVYTIQGNLIHREKIADENIEIDISSYTSGIYILTLSGDQDFAPLKIVIP